MDVTVDASQVLNLAVDFGKLGPELLAGIPAVVTKTCADTKADAQVFCPVDTGFLRGSISYETHRTKAGAWGQVGPTASYGDYVESGTSRMSPQPYMGPAFTMNTPPFVAACEILAGRVTP